MMSTRYFKGIFDLQYFQLMIGLLEHNPIISKGRPKLKTFFLCGPILKSLLNLFHQKANVEII